MLTKRYFYYILGICALIGTLSCDDFVDIDPPNFQIIGENVFANDETASAAMQGIYNELMRANFSNGWEHSVTVLAGMSADIIQPISTTHGTFSPFWQNEISTMQTPDANANLNLWSSAYNIIYLTNTLLEGIENSNGISENLKDNLKGQALFIRAFTYFYLTNLYGDVPLILSTNYQDNALALRSSSKEVWNQVENDLSEANEHLEETTYYNNGERTQVNKYVVQALRARVYLYQKNWVKAEELSSQVIAQSEMYEILEDLNKVFLANSKEAIWQISPVGNYNLKTTFEAQVFVRFPYSPSFVIGDIKIVDDFINILNKSDKRFINWIGSEIDETGEVVRYYPFKFKYRDPSGTDIPEYSMVLRLAEQYLIRAEARAMQNKVSKAIEDIDKLRLRAGLVLLADTNPNADKKGLLEIIMKERQVELFTEWGHRWLDLKRTNRTNEVLSSKKPLWQDTDVLFPIPDEERIKNPNLTQNSGY